MRIYNTSALSLRSGADNGALEGSLRDRQTPKKRRRGMSEQRNSPNLTAFFRREGGSTPSAVITRFESLDRPTDRQTDRDRMLMQRKMFLRSVAVGGRQISMGIVSAAEGGTLHCYYYHAIPACLRKALRFDAHFNTLIPVSSLKSFSFSSLIFKTAT